MSATDDEHADRVRAALRDMGRAHAAETRRLTRERDEALAQLALSHQRQQPQLMPSPQERLALSVEEVADRLGCGRTTVFALLKAGNLASVKVGRLTRVPLASVTAFLEGQR